MVTDPFKELAAHPRVNICLSDEAPWWMDSHPHQDPQV